MDRFVIKKPNKPPSPSTSSSVSNEGESTKQTKEKRGVYKQKFKEEWKKKFNWIEEGEGGSKCKVCNVLIVGSITHLQRHEMSKHHKKKIASAAKTPAITTLCKEPEEDSVEKHIKEAQLKLAMFLAEHNLPFSLIEHLSQLFNSICPNCKICKKLSMKRKKITQICTNVIAPVNKEEVINDLRKLNFSLIIDETTDVSTSKCLAVVARYVLNNQVRDRFLDLIELENSTARSLFDTLKNILDQHNIPFKNLIGLGADNCNVMMGDTNGLKGLFKQVNPSIIVIGCSCHSFHLCASHACEKLPSTVEQFCRDIYNYFSNSTKRNIELKECEVFCEEQPHCLLKPSQTRWLSLQQVINRILEHWKSLTLFFTGAAAEDKIHAASNILNALKNPIYKCYFLFLSYVLEIINQLNVEFQSETTKIHLLLPRVKSLFKLILKSFLKKSYLDHTDIDKINILNPSNYLPIEELYCGAAVSEFIRENNGMDKSDLQNFRLRVLEFYIELSKQIKKRFDFKDPVLNYALKFDPKVVISGDHTSVCEGVNLFPFLDLNIEKLDLEYRLLSEIDEIKKYNGDDIIEFWKKVSLMKNSLNERLFPNITKIVDCILSLPHSSATVERIFSQLNLIKSKIRNKLLTETSCGLLHAKDMLRVNGVECYNWKPQKQMLRINIKSIISTNTV